MARPLSQIPWSELKVGMTVVGAQGFKGQIKELLEKYPLSPVGMSPCISFTWERGQDTLYAYHGWLDKIFEVV